MKILKSQAFYSVRFLASHSSDCRTNLLVSSGCLRSCLTASSAKTPSIELIPGEEGGVAWPHPVAVLPSDLREGDLLVVPCIGAVTLRNVRPRGVGAAALRVEASR